MYLVYPDLLEISHYVDMLIKTQNIEHKDDIFSTKHNLNFKSTVLM